MRIPAAGGACAPGTIVGGSFGERERGLDEDGDPIKTLPGP